MRIAFVALSKHYTFLETVFNLKSNIVSNRDDIEIDIYVGENTYFKNVSNYYNLLIPRGIKEVFRIKFIKEFFRVRKQLLKHRYNTVIFFNAHPWALLLTYMLRNKVRIINSIHDVMPHNGDRNTSYVNLYNNAMLKVSREIIVHSEKSFSDLHQYKIKSKIYVTNLWRQYNDYVHPLESNTILMFGRLNWYKGVRFIGEIARKLPNVKIQIIGKADVDVLDTLNSLNKLKNVLIINSTINEEEMRKYFTESELIILPYETATQSGVIVDSYSFSKPVVAFGVGGIPEQISDGISGFLVEPYDVDGFCLKIKSYLELQYEKKKMFSFNAWKYGYDNYSTQIGYQRLLDIIFIKDTSI
jgi:glycosyltransferase involved in cell wall biosynthesis